DLICALSPRPVRTACVMPSALTTGAMPGMAASTRDTCELGSPPNAVEAPEKSFDCEVTWAWTSMPITTSQFPVVPLMNLDFISTFFRQFMPRGCTCTAACGRLLNARARCHKAAAVPRPLARNPEPAGGLGLCPHDRRAYWTNTKRGTGR